MSFILKEVSVDGATSADEQIDSPIQGEFDEFIDDSEIIIPNNPYNEELTDKFIESLIGQDTSQSSEKGDYIT
jgi:hypothetical protein